MTIYASDLLESVKSTVLVPGSQVTTPDAQILKFADDKIMSELVPMIKGVRQNYFLRERRTAGVSGVQDYPIPDRAIGRTLKDLKIDNDGTVSSLALVSIGQNNIYNTGTLPTGFYFIGDYYHLIPNPSQNTGWDILEYYHIQPSKLVELTAASRVSLVSEDTMADTTTFTVDGLQSGWNSGTLIDMVRGTGSGQIIEMDVEIGSTTPTTVVVSGVDYGVVEGDWLCNVKESPIIQLPDECFELLTVLTGEKVLEAESDYDGARALRAKVPKMSEYILELIAPRAENKNAVTMSRFNLTRRNRMMYWRGYRWP